MDGGIVMPVGNICERSVRIPLPVMAFPKADMNPKIVVFDFTVLYYLGNF